MAADLTSRHQVCGSDVTLSLGIPSIIGHRFKDFMYWTLTSHADENLLKRLFHVYGSHPGALVS